MKYKWIVKNNPNNNLVYFFNGWGMDENVFQKIKYPKNFDIIMFYDYQNLEIDKSIFLQCSKYKNKYLISWSMGVMISTIFEQELGKLNRKIAINGTIKPIDDNYGITKKIYNMTINNFDDSSSQKFVKKMFFKDKLILNLINRPICELKNELISLIDYKGNENFYFDLVYVSKYDKIIPYKNQINFWNCRNEKVITLDLGHFPFEDDKIFNESILI